VNYTTGNNGWIRKHEHGVIEKKCGFIPLAVLPELINPPGIKWGKHCVNKPLGGLMIRKPSN